MAYYEQRARRNGVPMPVEYILMTLSANKRVPRLHYHEYTELLFGISGYARVFIGRQSIELTEGAMVMVHSGEPHDVIPCGEPCTYHVVKFLPQILLTGEQTYSEYGYVLMLMDQLPGKQLLFGADKLAKTEVPELFRHLGEEWERQEFGYELSLRADVTRIFLYILRSWREKNISLVEGMFPSGQRELLQKAIFYIQGHYNDLSEEEAAAVCGVSAAYLSRVFKKGMKSSFSSYVNSVRLREAERLLLTTDDSITEIAQSVGFSTSAYFIALFRSVQKITPYQYRKLCRGGSLPAPGTANSLKSIQ